MVRTSLYTRIEGEQAPWRNRKGFLSQNVLAVCDFERNFTYILAGWEGSAHDGRVFASARSRDFEHPGGRHYYLADAGYVVSDMTLTPYRSTGYHLREWIGASKRPETKEELFNLRHFQLRNVIERTFGVFKNRVEITGTARKFSMRTQVRLIYALAGVHNLMNKTDRGCASEDLTEEDLDEVEDGDNDYTSAAAEGGGSIAMNELREAMSKRMWEDYQAYVAQR